MAGLLSPAPPASALPDPTSRQAAAPASGPVLFARYALGPNRLGLCGPDDWPALLELGASGADDRGLRELARGFEGAWPYLELLAREARRPDPLDPRVVESYWLGGDLAEAVRPAELGRSLQERFRGRLRRSDWRVLATKAGDGARPVHAFHVLDVFPRLGLLRGGDVADTLATIDACRIRAGRIIGRDGDRVMVAVRPLVMREGRLILGDERMEVAMAALSGHGFVGELRPGDVVSLHWDWVCDRLTPASRRRLEDSTARQLAIANRTL